jgi:Flp pilus assembly protein TadD
MLTVPLALDITVQHHPAGNLQQAQEIYYEILKVDPHHADALHLLGVIAHQMGRHQMAIDHIGQAIARNPCQASYHNNLVAQPAQGTDADRTALRWPDLHTKP